MFKLLSHSVYCTADGVLDGGGEETEREGEEREGESLGMKDEVCFYSSFITDNFFLCCNINYSTSYIPTL